jgi:hypothetical protein
MCRTWQFLPTFSLTYKKMEEDLIVPRSHLRFVAPATRRLLRGHLARALLFKSQVIDSNDFARK